MIPVGEWISIGLCFWPVKSLVITIIIWNCNSNLTIIHTLNAEVIFFSWSILSNTWCNSTGKQIQLHIFQSWKGTGPVFAEWIYYLQIPAMATDGRQTTIWKAKVEPWYSPDASISRARRKQREGKGLWLERRARLVQSQKRQEKFEFWLIVWH